MLTAPVSPAAAQPLLTEEVELEIRVRPILVVDGQSGSLAERRFTVGEERAGRLELALQWPETGRATRLELRASGRPGAVDGHHFLGLSATLGLPSGRAHRASRSLNVHDGSTALFEVYRDEAIGFRLTLALTVARKVRRFVPRLPSAGSPLRFRLEVEAVRGERTVPLETNLLQTFLGQPVEYAFRRGAGEEEESVTLRLTPIVQDGGVVELRVDVSGSLPAGGTRLVLSRGETLITSRGATSSLAVTSGTPPAGYRFSITPDF